MALHKKIFSSHWLNLPSDILVLILDCLRRYDDTDYIRVYSARDMIRVSAVCKSWQSIVNSLKQQVGPLLLLPKENDDEVYELFDFFKKNKTLGIRIPKKNKAREIRIPEIRNKWICNSWNEWLVTIKCISPYDKLHLLNLFSRVQIELPPPSTFNDPPFEGARIKSFIVKVIASCRPLDPDCIVMAIHSNYMKLAFCKPGDTRWKTVSSVRYCYRDVIYFKGDFYAVGQRGNLVVVCDIKEEEPKAVEIVPSVKPWEGKQMYLVASSSGGELFLVIRSLDWTEDNPCYFTVMFEVFKMDFVNRKWQAISSLGDNSIFVGHNLSISISDKELPIKSDCIYFNDDYREAYFGEDRGRHDMGVFNLKTQLVEPTLQFSRIWSSPLFWIVDKK